MDDPRSPAEEPPDSFAHSLALLAPFRARYDAAAEMATTARALGLARITLGFVPRRGPLVASAYLPLGKDPRRLEARDLERPCLTLPTGIRRTFGDVVSGAVIAAGYEDRIWGLWITTTRPIPQAIAADALCRCLGACLLLLRRPEGDEVPDLPPDGGPHDAILAARRFVRDGLRSDLTARRRTASKLADLSPGLARGLVHCGMLPQGLIELGDGLAASARPDLARHAYRLAYEASILLAHVRAGALAALRLGDAYRVPTSLRTAERWYEQSARLAVRCGARGLAFEALDGLCGTTLMRKRIAAVRRALSPALALAVSSGNRQAMARVHQCLIALEESEDDRSLPLPAAVAEDVGGIAE